MKTHQWIISLFILLLIMCECKQSTKNDNNKEPLVIKNLGVTFGPWNRTTNRAGDFLFLANEQKVFLEFGAIVSTGGSGTKELPTFEYRIRKDASVYAIADGKVNRFVYQEDTQDYEIAAEYTHNSDWAIGYDHVKNPRVKMGDKIAAGDTLGNPGTWNADLGRFEIMINNYATGLSYCPFCNFDSTKAAFYQQQVLQQMLDWEAFKRDTTIFDEKSHVFPGCRMESMVSY